MKENKEIHHIILKSEVVLPFRPILKPGEVSGIIPGEKWETKFLVSYPERLSL